jgi:hypothetical protein
VSSKPYTNLQNALMCIETAYRDLKHAREHYDKGEWDDFVMRVNWALPQVQSAVRRLEDEKEPEKR